MYFFTNLKYFLKIDKEYIYWREYMKFKKYIKFILHKSNYYMVVLCWLHVILIQQITHVCICQRDIMTYRALHCVFGKLEILANMYAWGNNE